jgi:hypothetical protein
MLMNIFEGSCEVLPVKKSNKGYMLSQHSPPASTLKRLPAQLLQFKMRSCQAHFFTTNDVLLCNHLA